MWNKFLLLLSFFVCARESSCFHEGIFAVGAMVWNNSKLLAETAMNSSGADLNYSFLRPDSETGKVLTRIEELSSQLWRENGNKWDGPSNGLIDSWKQEVYTAIATIDDMYQQLQAYVKAPSTPSDVWENFANRAIVVIPTYVIKLDNFPIVRYQLETGVLGRLANRTLELGTVVCRNSQSFHYFIKEFLALLMITEMKVTMILNVAYRIRHTIVDDKVAQTQEDMESRYMMYLNITSHVMSMTPTTIRRCDPEQGAWIRGESYIEMERLDQILLPPRTATFSYACSRITALEKLRHEYPSMTEDCDGGVLYNCVESPTERCSMNNDVRRYQWVTGRTRPWPFGEKYTYGMDYPKCSGETERSTCMCSCRKEKENAVSLVMTETDVETNMVVTGARLIRKNKTLWIQLKQGKLLPNLQIDPMSQSWMPVPDDFDSSKAYVTMSMKRFSLINDAFPAGYALTGLQFITNVLKKTISLKLHGHQYDTVNGTLLPKIMSLTLEPQYIHPHAIILYRKGGIDRVELKYTRRNSIHTNAVNTPDDNSDWIELQRSQYQHDVGQSVLPLFDSQPVETDPPSPLGGIGLFYKGSVGYAGFIALQLHSLSYQQTIDKLIENHVNGTMFGIPNLPVSV